MCQFDNESAGSRQREEEREKERNLEKTVEEKRRHDSHHTEHRFSDLGLPQGMEELREFHLRLPRLVVLPTRMISKVMPHSSFIFPCSDPVGLRQFADREWHSQ